MSIEPLADFRLVLDAMPDIACVLTPDGLLLYMNRVGREYFGPDASLRQDGWYDVVVPSERERAATHWPRPGSETRAWDAEFTLCRHDGEFRRAMVRARPVLGDSGRPAVWLVTTTDVEDERRLGDELRRRAMDMGLVLAVADDAARLERTRLAALLRQTAIEPLEAAVQRLRGDRAQDSELVAQSVAAIREALEGA
ncbi:MAG: PAS domain-containing protein [Solirubrobacteraceae bacterium]|nr:PAS domain-containing protein [Solirubrobacteraceae bacterium]